MLCDGGESVVVASDRMWTDRRLSIEFEHGESKLAAIADRAVVGAAGDAVAPTELINRLTQDIQAQGLKEIGAMAERAKHLLARERTIRINDDHFVQRGFTLDKFYSGGLQQRLNPNLVQRLDRIVETYDFSVDLILAGHDGTGGHIHAIFSPGREESLDRLGYGAVGSGSPHVESTLILDDFSRSYDVKEAVFLAYKAKKAAEKAPGVGEMTDMAVIDAEGVAFLSDDDFRQLEEIYQEVMAASAKPKGISARLADIHVGDG